MSAINLLTVAGQTQSQGASQFAGIVHQPQLKVASPGNAISALNTIVQSGQPASILGANRFMAAATATPQVGATHPAANGLSDAPPEIKAFLGKVLIELPKTPPPSYVFKSWPVSGRSTEAGVGAIPRSELPEKVRAVSMDQAANAVMDVDHYTKNIDHVAACNSKSDPRFTGNKVRFYQHLSLPVISDIHHELVLVDAGMVNNVRIIYWYILKPETDALAHDDTIARSDYSYGAWMITDQYIAYALNSAPKRSDVNIFTWAALTTGANIGASAVIKSNLEGMATWAVKRK